MDEKWIQVDALRLLSVLMSTYALNPSHLDDHLMTQILELFKKYISINFKDMDVKLQAHSCICSMNPMFFNHNRDFYDLVYESINDNNINDKLFVESIKTLIHLLNGQGSIDTHDLISIILNHLSQESETIKIQLLSLLRNLCERDIKSVIAEWTRLFPTHVSSKDLTILTLLTDTENVRSMTAITIMMLFSKSSPYISQATNIVNIKSRLTFKSYFDLLGKIIENVYTCLILHLQKETSILVKSSIYKAFSSIFSNTNLHKIRIARLEILFKFCQRDAKSRDKTLQSASLECLNALLIKNPIKEVDLALVECIQDLICILFEINSNFMRDATECLQHLIQNYPNHIKKHWDSFMCLLCDAKENKIEIATSLSKIKMSLDLWMDFEAKILSIRHESNSPLKQSQLILIYSNLHQDLWKQLNESFKKSLVEWLFDNSESSHHLIQSAFCRTIGTLVLFDDYNKDPTLLQRIQKSMMKYSRENVSLCQRITFCVSSLCETISKLPDCCNLDTYHELFRFILDLLHGHEKTLSNAIRALGWLLQVATSDFLCSTIQVHKNQSSCHSFCQEILEKFVKSESSKLKWNTCLVIGKCFLNVNIPYSQHSILSLLNCLGDPNYKVRIASAKALSNLSFIKSNDLDRTLAALQEVFETDEKFGQYVCLLKLEIHSLVLHLVQICHHQEDHRFVLGKHSEFLRNHGVEVI